jgi:hypothetical protein
MCSNILYLTYPLLVNAHAGRCLMSDCKAAVVQQKSSKVASSLAPPVKFLLSAYQTSFNRRRAQRAFPAAARPMACQKRQKTKIKLK